jgi:hypothetical protein
LFISQIQTLSVSYADDVMSNLVHVIC